MVNGISNTELETYSSSSQKDIIMNEKTTFITTTTTTIKSHVINSIDDDIDYSNNNNDNDDYDDDEYEYEYCCDSLAKLGDLPIVREGSELDEEIDNMILMSDGSSNRSYIVDEYDAGQFHHHHNHLRHYHYQMESDDDNNNNNNDNNMDNNFEQYQREQEELQREMNLNKIAFTAYRNAVLHLVHNQASFGKVKQRKCKNNDNVSSEVGTSTDEDLKLNISKSNDSEDTTDTTDEANERITLLEEIAKHIIETKAKACFEALAVVEEFDKRRKEKRIRSKMLVGGIKGMGNQDNMLLELRKLKKRSLKKHSDKDNESKERPQKHFKEIVTSIDEKLLQKKKQLHSGPVLRLKKKQHRHLDCIKATLPCFQFVNSDDEINGATNEDFSKPAKYGTTTWIKSLVKWRIQRNKHEEATLTKCGCPDCLKDFESLKMKK